MAALALRTMLVLGLVLLAIHQLGLGTAPVPERAPLLAAAGAP